MKYLQDYASHFDIRPRFNHAVSHAQYDARTKLWHVHTADTEFRARWLVVASGENAEPVVPSFPGALNFRGQLMHSSSYRNGEEFQGKKVLVVGCGNTGMEIALDLANYGASPSLVVRSPVSPPPLWSPKGPAFEIHRTVDNL